MAVVNFPDNPSDGDTQDVGGITYTYSSSKGYWTAAASSGGGGGGGASVTTDDAAPSSPSDGDLWYDTDTGGMFVYYEDVDSSQWVEVIGSQGSPGADGAAGADGGAGVTSVYATVDNLPTSGNSQGDMAHVTANNTLYFWNGSGWYKIALINTNPSISGVSSSYSLAIDGTATVVTVTATDPEGLPITYSIASDTSGNIATVAQGTGASSNVFTVTPSTNTANAGSFTLTFRASDGVNIATAPASFTLQFSVQNSKYTTALITSVGANLADNNDFVDSSTNNQTITVAGNVTQTTFSPYRHGGYSYHWDGSGTDYFQILSPTAALDFGTGDFTIEMWIWLNDLSTAIILADTRPSETNGNQYIGGFSIGTDGNLGMNTGNVSRIATTGAPITAGSWHHIALQRNNGTLEAYVDGSRNATASFTQSLDANRWSLFKNSFAGGGVADAGGGYIKDYRVVKGTAVYSGATYDVPTEPLTAVSGTSFLLFSSRPTFTYDAVGTESITWTNGELAPFSPYDYNSPYSASTNGGSLYNDGTGTNYLSVTSNDFQFGTSDDFVIEAWVYPTATPTGAAQIFDNRGAANGLNLAFTGAFASYSEPLASQLTGTTKSLNQWYHVAVVRYNGTRRLFVNGVSEDSVADTGNYDSNSGIIASRWSTDSQAWNGNISDFRIIRGTIPAAYQGTSITVPTAPLAADSYTKLHLKSTNAGIIDKSQTSSVLVLDGDTKCSSTQTKYRSTAIYTDGTGDRVRFGINNKKLVCDWGVGGEPFTVEWWMYDTQPYTAQHSFGPQTGGGAGAWNASTGHQWITYWNNSVLNIYYYGTNGNYSGNTCTAAQLGIVQNQWQHVAHTYDGTTWRLYVDGVHGFHWVLPVQPASVSGTFAALGSFAEPAYYTAAYYDDVRITKGLARYTGTSSFTPPAAALKG